MKKKAKFNWLLNPNRGTKSNHLRKMYLYIPLYVILKWNGKMQIYRNVKTGHTSFHCYFLVTREKRCSFRFQKGIPKHSPPRLRAFAKTIHSHCRGRSACCLIPGAVQWTMLSLFKHLNYTGEACLLIHRIIELGQLTLDSLAFSLTAHCTLLICINEQNVEGVDQFI